MGFLETFLEKYKKLEDPKKKKERIILLIKDISGISLSENDVYLKNNFIELKVSSSVKMVLFFHKEKILESLKKEFKTIEDIKGF